MDELKPCPFCGGKARHGINYLGQHYVACENCFSHVWENDKDHDKKQDTIERWNRRVNNG